MPKVVMVGGGVRSTQDQIRQRPLPLFLIQLSSRRRPSYLLPAHFYLPHNGESLPCLAHALAWRKGWRLVKLPGFLVMAWLKIVLKA